MALTAKIVWRNYVTDGIPSSGNNKTKKSEARTWGTGLEETLAITAQLLSSDVARATKAELDAIVADYDDGDIGLVVLDNNLALRGVYVKEAGVWVKHADLPNEAAQAAQAALADFRTRYLGAFATDPAADPEGNPLTEGALYFNSASGLFRVYHSAAWQNQTTAVADGAITDAKLDPTSNAGLLADTETFRLTYHKARSAWHVKAYQTGTTAVGVGTTSADQAALAAAMASQEMIDIDGTILQIEDPIVINYSSANISARKSGRVGDAATSKIKVMDDTMPYLFDCQATNFEAAGFAITGNTTNSTTIAFHFKRPDGSASDIDSVLKDIVIERLAKPFHIYGRGLEVGDFTFAEMKTSCGDIDWPSVWTPNGQSNDTQETGMRAYHFYNGRLHGNNTGFRNIGANAQNMRGLIIDGMLADIGIGAPLTDSGGIFVGVLGEGSILTNLVANMSASIGGNLVALRPGSRASIISNFTCRGIKAGVTRVLRTPITIETSAANPVVDLVFANGSLGVCNRDGILITGAGEAYITLDGINFDRTNMEAATYSPIRIVESGGTLTDVWVKMDACNFRFGGELAPNHIVGGLNSAAVHLRRGYTTTKPSAVSWAQGLVDNVGP